MEQPVFVVEVTDEHDFDKELIEATEADELAAVNEPHHPSQEEIEGFWEDK